MRINERLALVVAGTALLCAALAKPTAAQFATKEWYDSTGAANGFTDAAKALGEPSANATLILQDPAAYVSVGAKGSLVLGFANAIQHTAANPGGYDFTIFGSGFYVLDNSGNQTARFQRPGIVEVGIDTVGDGQYHPDKDTFYLIKGSANPAYSFHDLPINTVTNGYSGVTPTNGAGNPLIPTPARTATSDSTALAPGSSGGDSFMLSWAVDANGNSVNLDHVDFIRIHSADLPDSVTPNGARQNYTVVDAAANLTTLRSTSAAPAPGSLMVMLLSGGCAGFGALRRKWAARVS